MYTNIFFSLRRKKEKEKEGKKNILFVSREKSFPEAPAQDDLVFCADKPLDTRKSDLSAVDTGNLFFKIRY